MALKNDGSISALGKRLLELMEENGYQSPKELAKDLLEQNLIHVKSRDCFNTEERIRGNALLSIEKKIVRHIKTGCISDDSGKYILGYCKLLNCASDYLLGLTPIKAPDIEVRRICEITGLSEAAVTGFIQYNDYPDPEKDYEPEHQAVAGWWSYILGSDLLFSIPNDLRIASEEVIEGYRLQAELLVSKWVAEHAIDYETVIAHEETVRQTTEMLHNLEPHLQGMLYKISREFISTLEHEIVEVNKRDFENYPEERLKQFIRISSRNPECFKEGSFENLL